MSKIPIRLLAAAVIGVFAAAAISTPTVAQSSNVPHWAPSFWTPDSNRQNPADVGFRAHTNVAVLTLPQARVTPPQISPLGVALPQSAPQLGYFYETPSSLACVYGLVAQTTGCNPNSASSIPSSSASPLAIAIVDAYDNQDASSDLTTFSKQFGLPAPASSNFQVVYASGSKPSSSTGRALESSLDIEWAHAMSQGPRSI